MERAMEARVAQRSRPAVVDRIRNATMEKAPINVPAQLPDDAPADKKEYYDSVLGKGWLERAQELLKHEAVKEADALEDTGDPHAHGGEDEDEGINDEDGDEDELLRDPNATYVPAGGASEDVPGDEESTVANGEEEL